MSDLTNRATSKPRPALILSPHMRTESVVDFVKCHTMLQYWYGINFLPSSLMRRLGGTLLNSNIVNSLLYFDKQFMIEYLCSFVFISKTFRGDGESMTSQLIKTRQKFYFILKKKFGSPKIWQIL